MVTFELFHPAALAAGVVTGPQLLADRQWLIGGVAVAVGAAVGAVGARQLHLLSRRWLVFVPAGVVKLELDLEYFEAGFGGSTSEAFAPAAYVLVEWGLYGGVGVGVTISDTLDDNVSDPFYAARLGWDFQVLPRLHVDVHANYRANTFAELEDYDSDSITLGAALRVALGSRR